MSNSQKQISDLMHEWGLKMQESMKDPKLADIITQYYNQYQNIIKDFHDATKAQDSKPGNDEGDANKQIHQLSQRVAELENKIKLLERIVCSNIK